MDHAEPPKIVFEQPSPLCSDAARAEETLKRTLAPARGPGVWSVTMRASRARTGVVRGEGEIVDDLGAPVAHREFTSTSYSECSGLARAIGVWASLVLDAELERAKKQQAESARAIAAAKIPMPSDAGPSLWPAPVVNEKAPPQYYSLLQHDPAKRSVEIGFSTFLMSGTGTGALVGPAAFMVIEIDKGLYLRPMIAAARTLEPLTQTGDVYGTWGATRFDVCLRIPGMYLEKRGLQLDTCGGADLGFLHFDAMSADPMNAIPAQNARTIPYFALGPTLSMRGELDGNLSVELRGLFLVNLIRETFVDSSSNSHVDPPLLAGRVELGLSWRWR